MKHGTAGGYRYYRCPCKKCRQANRDDRNARRAARRAQRVEIDGRMVAPLPAHFHGKVQTYGEWCCRCIPCTAAVREAQRDYVARCRARQEEAE